MKCPLLTMVAYPITEPINHADRNCLKEECAWWDETTNRCLWLNVNEELSFIHLELKEIREMIPPAEK